MKISKFILGVIVVCSLCFLVSCAKKKIAAPHQSSEVKQKVEQQQKYKGLEALRESKEQKVKLKAQNLQQNNVKEKIDVKKVLGERIYFDFDSYELKPEARKILQEKAKILKMYPKLKIVIEGHCDERGTEEYNLALGEKRARAAYEFLILLGINANRMQIVSYGEEYPLDPAHNETAWAKNRRDEFKIIEQ
ncbi:peptidoglycan-associated lipoprotein [Desulfonauticus submarinus]|uniref:Peptidoglycan-associated lipoprotein n=1 Tax=Desulfonauticus submarinus TaxID=206665 RepID=A0A1G9ZIV1_9BACT|nr:peptidoglycan-associated lipoprotein Pal [Desulfonauticus submarinus]SDN21244.1 peptidoglycan-associated lipoprotein [Desulfonauticus submarinus]